MYMHIVYIQYTLCEVLNEVPTKNQMTQAYRDKSRSTDQVAMVIVATLIHEHRSRSVLHIEVSSH